MINTSIESSDFLFRHATNFKSYFSKFYGKRIKWDFTCSNLVCVYTHSKFQNMKFNFPVSHKNFKNSTQIFFHTKIENQSFRLMCWSYMCDLHRFLENESKSREGKFKTALRLHFLTHFTKKSFAAFSHRKVKVAQIWYTHQSKAMIFYFGMKKILRPIFENFVGNRQIKFHILKFRVCVNTH